MDCWLTMWFYLVICAVLFHCMASTVKAVRAPSTVSYQYLVTKVSIMFLTAWLHAQSFWSRSHIWHQDYNWIWRYECVRLLPLARPTHMHTKRVVTHWRLIHNDSFIQAAKGASGLPHQSEPESGSVLLQLRCHRVLPGRLLHTTTILTHSHTLLCGTEGLAWLLDKVAVVTAHILALSFIPPLLDSTSTAITGTGSSDGENTVHSHPHIRSSTHKRAVSLCAGRWEAWYSIWTVRSLNRARSTSLLCTAALGWWRTL
jgi:hypothetical protein